MVITAFSPAAEVHTKLSWTQSSKANSQRKKEEAIAYFWSIKLEKDLRDLSESLEVMTLKQPPFSTTRLLGNKPNEFLLPE